MYDRPADRNSNYIPAAAFKGLSGIRSRFVAKAVYTGIKSDIVILSHINLLFVAYIIKKLSPKTRIIVYAHGIEIWRSISSWKKKFLSKHCEIWAVSDFTAKKIMTTHGVPAANISIVPNCLDPYLEIPEEFEKPRELLQRYHLKPNQPVLFTLSRLSSHELYKGYDLVLESLPELIRLFPNLHYLLAGRADEKEHERLQNMINALGISADVTLTGFIPDEELSVHFLLTDVFVMPSRKEGFGIVFIEAAASGCKIIGGNQDGSPQALLQGRLGTLIDPENKEALVKAITKSLNKPRSKRSSQTIQNLCLENFNYHQFIQRINELLIPDGEVAKKSERKEYEPVTL